MSDTETDVEANQNYDGPDDSQLKQLHRRLTISNFIELRNNFAKNLEKKISKCEFRELLKDIADIEYEDEEFELLFLKLDLSSDSGYVSWYSFLMHIMATFQAEEIEKYAGQLEAPISRIQKEMKSPHRHPILRITFIPEILQNRQCNHLNGSYITCSRDGIIHFWTIEFEHEKDAVSHSYTLKTIPTWVTDVVSMPDVNILCLSCTERELRFYDVCANKFDLRMVITNLEDYVNTLTYTFYTDIDKESKLIFGDATGRVRLLEFKAKNRGPFRGSTQMPVTVVRYEDFAKGVIPMMTLKVLASHHSGPVVQVAYFEAIHCVLSVSARSDKSMFVCSTKSKDYFYTFHIPGICIPCILHK